MRDATDLPPGAIASPNVLYWASLGRLAEVERFLDAGEDANSTDGEGYSALQAAAENNHLDVAALLIGRGANVNYRSSFTALELARMAGHGDMVELLIARGAQQ